MKIRRTVALILKLNKLGYRFKEDYGRTGTTTVAQENRLLKDCLAKTEGSRKKTQTISTVRYLPVPIGLVLWCLVRFFLNGKFCSKHLPLTRFLPGRYLPTYRYLLYLPREALPTAIHLLTVPDLPPTVPTYMAPPQPISPQPQYGGVCE